ncbi:MAG: tRNA (adenosine(37)-N6)-threonylcarbamoyltransferase complex transferase subunit TsaD [Candidatus Paceibacterota bacterium]
MDINENTKLTLAFETSCDETGVCLLHTDGQYPDMTVTVVANELATQIDDHQEYGGVFPSLAKRLHGENLPVLLEKILSEAKTNPVEKISDKKKDQIREWLQRHDGLADRLFSIIKTHGLPSVDAVAVTVGPGLEPALWVGINVARAIALILDVPVIPTNHMEGHLISGLAPDSISDGSQHTLAKIDFPAIALLVSGGHTELIYIKDWHSYKKIGQTRDDAAGEAFDKVGRLLGLPYPAGPHVSRLAEQAREIRNSKLEISTSFSLPRPMIDSDNLDFSFSGLKSAAARYIEANGPLSDSDRALFARELEEAIVEVLVLKTARAVEKTGAETLLVGGGVSANQYLRKQLQNIENTSLLISPLALAGDNAVMIGLAAASRYTDGIPADSDITADSRLSL